MGHALELETTSRMVTVPMPQGTAEAFFATPKEGKHPGVLLWPDVSGLREAFMTMATRLASAGYSVLAVNHYYRSARLPVFRDTTEWRTEAGKAKLAPLRAELTPQNVASDGKTFALWLDAQPEVNTGRKLGSAGYCMTGSYAFRAAAALPERVGALASFHGGGLVTSEPTSPHTLFAKMRAQALICISQSDDAREPDTQTVLRQSAEDGNVPSDIEVYPAQHGFCVIDVAVYDPVQAERAWSKMLSLFARSL